MEDQDLSKHKDTTANKDLPITDSIRQPKKRKPYKKRKTQTDMALEEFLTEMFQRDIESVNKESAMLNQLTTQLEAILLNLKLKLKYNELQLSLQEYREKVSQSNLNINLEPIIQNQYNFQPQQNTKQPNFNNVYNFPIEPKIPDLSAFNPDGTAVLPGGDIFTSTPVIT